MLRLTFVFLAGVWTVGPARAASSVDGLFQELTKDFGAVPRGPVLHHGFPIKNVTNDTVHISGIRVSCGCLTATALKSVLAPGEETTLAVRMDTTRFTGAKNASIYVQFDRPRSEEVRLWVRANARDDVALTPETLAFGQVPRGSSPTATVRVTLRGQGDARVMDVRTDSNYVQPTLRELSRSPAEVVYELTAQLRPDAPVGKWYTDVWLQTTTPALPRFRVPLTVEIESALSVTPPVLSLGDVKVGAEVERKVIVRGVKPFRITGVRGTDGLVSVMDNANVNKPVHVLTVKVKAQQAGRLDRVLQILTDLDGQSAIDVRAVADLKP